MDEREAQRAGYPLTIPASLLESEAMRQACATHNFGEIFRLVNRRTGSSYATMAAAIGKMTSSRISDVIRGVRSIRGQGVIERIVDAFGIPGAMLDLPPRPWESTLALGTTQHGEVVSVDRRSFVSASAAALAVGPMAATQLEQGRRVVQALSVMGADSPGAFTDGLGELIDHYALTISTTPPADVYDELLLVRSHASEYLDSYQAARAYADLNLATGWLSCLLGIAACDMGTPAAAHVWCADAERRSREAGHPELAGWAMLTRSMIAFYQGRPHQSMTLAAAGQHATPPGTAIHARLAAQEMRTAAMVGDAEGMETARRYAASVMAKLPSGVKKSGAFSIALADDPPYTATSFMLLGRFQEAVAATNRVIRTHYHPETRGPEVPPGHARALLILALAQTGTGDLDEAVAAGHDALVGDRPAWPTLVLAGKLDRALKRDFANARQTAEYHARYLETTNR